MSSKRTAKVQNSDEEKWRAVCMYAGLLSKPKHLREKGDVAEIGAACASPVDAHTVRTWHRRGCQNGQSLKRKIGSGAVAIMDRDPKYGA